MTPPFIINQKFSRFGLVYYTKLKGRMSTVFSIKYEIFYYNVKKPGMTTKALTWYFFILENLRILIQYLVYSLYFLIE